MICLITSGCSRRLPAARAADPYTRFVPVLKGKKDYSHNPVYTRFLTTSYKRQLLAITFNCTLDTDPKLKEEINRIMDSVRLEE
jgi:hypothetical protein